MPTDPQLMSTLTTLLWDMTTVVIGENKLAPSAKKRRIRAVNQTAAKLARAFKAAAREHVRQLPGRAQKGAVDAALSSVGPTVKRALRGRTAKA